jgi:hypothetical protein
MLELLRNTPDGEELLLRVTGWSMLPLLFHNRSLVYLKKENAYVPRKGDIVLFRRLDGSFVLHRVHRVEENGILTINGDAQSWTEQIVPAQVMATVTRYVRFKRDVSVDSLGHRVYRSLWCPLRRLHPIGAKAVYYWHRVPQKLFRRKK